MSQVWLPGGGDLCCGCRSRSFQAEKDVKGIQTEKVAGAKLCEGKRPSCLWEMGYRWGGWPKATQRGGVKRCLSVALPVKEEVSIEVESSSYTFLEHF